MVCAPITITCQTGYHDDGHGGCIPDVALCNTTNCSPPKYCSGNTCIDPCITNPCTTGCPTANSCTCQPNTCACQPCLAGCPDATTCSKCGNTPPCGTGCSGVGTCTCDPTLCECYGDKHCDAGCSDASDPVLCPIECAGTSHCNSGCPDATTCGMCGNEECPSPSPLGMIVAIAGVALIGGFMMFGGGGSSLVSDSGGLAGLNKVMGK
jgi:hypothetical protein